MQLPTQWFEIRLQNKTQTLVCGSLICQSLKFTSAFKNVSSKVGQPQLQEDLSSAESE
jgi:hypothetical protein